MIRALNIFIFTGCLAVAVAPAAPARTASSTDAQDCRRLIVKYRDTDHRSVASTRQIRRLQSAAGRELHYRRTLGGGAYLLSPGGKFADRASDNRTTVARLRDDPDVEYAECDARRYITQVPDDPYYKDLLGDEQQWYLHEPEGGINAEQAWNITLGSNTVVTAVVDSGILPHSDLNETRLLDGYDFISDTETANDGDGRDDDPQDNGDHVTEAESGESDGPFEDCEVSDSSWHGTRIAGIIGAHTDNGEGIAGIDWTGSVLPVRALGKCGGFISDITDAIRWAAGLSVPGVPDNPTPADVINLSLGSPSECSELEKEAIQAAVDTGALVTVAAGNGGRLTDDTAPANCDVDGMVVVAATTREGAETCYTNVGEAVDLSAPGGNRQDDANGCSADVGIYSTSNNGTEGPDTETVEAAVGTSFAAPMAAGAAALLRAEAPELTPVQLETVLRNSTRPFPENTDDGFRDCAPENCGTGILDINKALETATGVDATPEPFVFEDEDDATRSTSVESNTVTIQGINIQTPIRVDNGEYAVDGGAYTADSGYVESGASVTVRLTASSQYATTVDAVLTVGGVSDTFSVTTENAPPPPSSDSDSDSDSDSGGSVSSSGGGGGHPAGLVMLLAGLVMFRFFTSRKRLT